MRIGFNNSSLRITAPSRYASAQGLARPPANCPPVTRSQTQATCQSLTSRSGTQGRTTSGRLVRYTTSPKILSKE
ncbi:hypothetical protein EHR00_01340 [Leptospira levettii]|uniref:Uncharacterized protein n=1 Tax=Leptospira levettii TaxID=2023178 RepID=A0ABY2MMX2_9LEPT|nr:hypothetical protein EHQ60_11000 [Leptospira levettii]TGM87868.1 hypothetical protein EHR00_01340 [Leptospira levettii]